MPAAAATSSTASTKRSPASATTAATRNTSFVPAEAVAAIPDDLPAAEAAPLLCAGITVFNALRNSGARAGDLVAVQGIGGLGHLGIQYARQMGFRTFAIGRGKDKEPLARKARRRPLRRHRRGRSRCRASEIRRRKRDPRHRSRFQIHFRGREWAFQQRQTRRRRRQP